MINYREKIADILAPHIEGLEKDEILSMIEVPADSSKGDYAFPCFKLAKIMRKAPPMIAKSIAEAIEGRRDVPEGGERQCLCQYVRVQG